MIDPARAGQIIPLQHWGRIVRSSAVAVSLIAAAIATGAATARADDKLPLNISHGPIMPFTDVIVASQMGFFDKAGLDVKRKVLGQSDVLRAALASGDIDIVALSTDTLVRAHTQGFDWKLVFQTDIYDSTRPDAILIGRADETFNTVKDLEGKTVAVSSGAISETALLGFMADNGANSSTLKTIDIPFAQIIGALQSKSLDAAHIVEPFMTMAIENGTGKLAFKHLDAVSKRFLISGLVAKQSWIDANPEKLKRFVAAMSASVDYLNKNPDEVLPVLAKETKIDPELLKKIFPIHYVITTQIRPEEIQSVIDFMAREKQIDKSFSYRDIISPTMPIADN
jgi:NitT/TauT family transport system substrate-binding protein